MSRAFPKISVVTPTRNRLSKLQACVKSVLASSYPPDCFELVVVNDGSSDGTQNYLTHLAEQQNQVRVLHQERQGPAAARNRGVASANGDLIAFTDDDCTVASDWLLSIAKAMKNPNVNALGGRVYGVGDHVIANYMEHIRALEPRRFSDGQVRYLVTANACFRKSLLEQVGGFDEKFQHAGEDVEISFRLLQSGINLDFFPSCRVYHHYENSSEEFLQRFYIYGVGSRYNFEKHKALVMWHRGADKQLLSWLAGDFKSGKVKPRGFFEIKDLLTRLHFSLLDAIRNIAYLAGYLLIQSETQILELIGQHEIEQLNYLKSAMPQRRALRIAKTEAVMTALCNKKLSLVLIDKIDQQEAYRWLNHHLTSALDCEEVSTWLQEILNELDANFLLKIAKSQRVISIQQDLSDVLLLNHPLPDEAKLEWEVQARKNSHNLQRRYVDLLLELNEKTQCNNLDCVISLCEYKPIDVNHFLSWYGDILRGRFPKLEICSSEERIQVEKTISSLMTQWNQN